MGDAVGAHEMLRRDVAEAVVAAAAHTPFEATHRIFVLERADVMNDEAANALLKTLEEPPSYVVLILLTDRPTQVLPTIASRCQAVRFDPPPPGQLAQRLQSQGVPPRDRRGGRAAQPRRREQGARARARRRARAQSRGGAASPARRCRARPGPSARGGPCSTAPASAASRPRRRSRPRSSEELQYLPKKEHKRRETEFTERARRADRRAATQALDHALQLTGLWYRDLTCVAAGVPELAFHSDRESALDEDAGRDEKALRQAIELVDDTRARLILNVSEELACEALAYRLEETLS